MQKIIEMLNLATELSEEQFETFKNVDKSEFSEKGQFFIKELIRVAENKRKAVTV